MALVDANYKFIYIDVGSNGRASDGGVYRNSSLSQALEEGSLNIPNGRKMLGDTNAGPMTIVADDAFPLRSNILKPYPGRGLNRERRIFNYRLSRAQRVVENAFGILSNRFRLFHTVVALSPAKTELAVLATCVLHNYLIGDEPENMFDREDFTNHELLHGQWREISSECKDLQHSVQIAVHYQQGQLGMNFASIFKLRVKYHGNGTLSESELTKFEMVFLHIR